MSQSLKTWYIKAFSWEYWPMWLVYLPVSFYYVYLSIRAGSFFFFSASNPSIEYGGMFFESKQKIFELIPRQYYPSTVYIDGKDDFLLITKKIKAAGITYPLIAKPDRGERGWCVMKIESENELADYTQKMPVSFIIQEYINHPLEFSIFYFRHPKRKTGKVTSVTFKKMLTVTGDGFSTVEKLIQNNSRSFLQYPKLRKNKKIDLNRILPKGEQKVLVPYGNHVLGAMFLNYNHIIDDRLEKTIDHISQQIEGFYFGRYDLRCTSIEDLKNGKNISILELNGAGAEPAHIYDPSFSFFKAQLVIAAHYKMMYDAAKENRKKGISFMSFSEFSTVRKSEKIYKGQVVFS